MHDLVTVQVAQRHYYLSRNMPHSVFGQSLHFVQIVVDVAAGHVSQEKVDALLILKHKLHRVHKRVVCLEKDLFFVFDILHLVFFDDHVFV